MAAAGSWVAFFRHDKVFYFSPSVKFVGKI
jgi:hypothetical protein